MVSPRKYFRPKHRLRREEGDPVMVPIDLYSQNKLHSLFIYLVNYYLLPQLLNHQFNVGTKCL